MKIIYFAAEVFPFIKTGGLADVLGSLPKKMKELGHEVSVFMPKYNMIPEKYTNKMEYVTSLDEGDKSFNILKYRRDEIDYYFIENSFYYDRGHIYGDEDEDFQFSMFCEMSLRFLKKLNLKADILHCNDWHTGPIPFFLKTRYINDTFYENMKVIYTIHNLMYQGKFNNNSFEALGYKRDSYSINFMEIGIVFSDIVNTVSESYAEEIKDTYYSEGLEWITNTKKIYGILNGIDEKYYNPKTMTGIVNYGRDDRKNKKINKENLQELVGLPKSNDILISIVSRLVEGKGLDLVSSKIEDLLKNDNVQFLILGSGSKYYEDYYNFLAIKYPEKFKVHIGFNVDLSNKIFAGSDMMLIPSRYEPCGLTQMIAMRFGTIPLVRETGGLKDTVVPYNEFSGEGNGFTFKNFNADEMLKSIRYAINIYNRQEKVWDTLIKKNMGIDVSWEKSALKYEKMYKKLI